jgi:hypothetical protein
MLVAQGLDAPCFPQCSRLPANLASVKGLVCGDSDALANGLIPTTVHVEAQPAILFFHLQHFKLGSACRFEFGNQGQPLLAKRPSVVPSSVGTFSPDELIVGTVNKRNVLRCNYFAQVSLTMLKAVTVR